MKNIKEMPQDVQVRAETLVMRPVRMVVIYKPTNEATMKDVPLKDCRRFFEAAVVGMRKRIIAKGRDAGRGFDADDFPSDDFIAVQIDFEDKTVITSSL